MENFNELFKKKLDEQQFDGKEKYWAQLEDKLNESAQEKVVIAWYKKWLLPFIAIAIIGTAAVFLNKSDSKNGAIALQTNDKIAPLQAAQEVEEISNSNNEINQHTTSSSQNNTINNAEPTQGKVVEMQQSNEIDNTLNTSTSATPNKTNEQSRVGNKQASINDYSKSEKSLSIAKTNSPNNISKEPILSNSDNEDNINANNAIVASIVKPDAQTEFTNETSTNASLSNTNDEYVASATNQSNRALDFSQVEMPLAYLSPKALSALIYSNTIANIAANELLIKPAKTKCNISLSAYSGAQLSMKNLLTTDGNSADYINRRKNEEANSIKPNAGIDIEMKRGHWSLTSGVNFHQQGENRNYSDEFKRIVPYDSLVININNNSAWLVDSSQFYALQYNSIITSQDTTITYYDEATGLFYTANLPINITQSTIIDTNFYYTIDSTYISAIDTQKTNYELKKQIVVKDPNQANLKGRNTFTYIEIPILFGYEWGIKRWRLSVKGGIGVGMLTRQQSFYLTTDEAEIAPVSTDVYTKIMYNGIVRAGLHYNFTPQFGIDIVPFSRVNINNMTNKNATFQQKYSNVGLQVGLNYKL